jgi:hypothetical protein
MNSEDKLEKAKEIITNMAEALSDFVSIFQRLGSTPVYGRDARNMGVEDGYSVAPNDYAIELAKENAIDACREAKLAGLIDDVPYYLQ